MIITGTVQGDAAKMRPEFAYRKPIMRRIKSAWDVDPERLNYADEYPRSVNPPCSMPQLESVTLADYEMVVKRGGATGWDMIQVWMRPNAYTQAKEPRLVYQCNCISSALSIKTAEHLILTEVFTRHCAQ
jgi:hypothetical protein